MKKVKQKYFYIFLKLFLIVLTTALFLKTSFANLQNPREMNNILIYSNIDYYSQDEDNSKITTGSSSERRSHLLDIYQPKDCEQCPVIIYIHGGYWVLGDKGGLSYKAKAFTDNGYIYISINYSLAPDYQFPVNAQDVAQAFFWVKNNITGYGGDAEQIYLLGHSAGGHLAALIGLDGRYLSPFSLSPSDISGIIGLDSAAYYLPSLIEAEPENKDLFYWAFGDNPEDWEKASPINYVREKQKGQIVPPFLLLVAGGREVSKSVNLSFYQRLIDSCYEVTLLEFKEKDHVSIDYELGEEDDPVFPSIIYWLHEHEL